jgi:hypothetical protein
VVVAGAAVDAVVAVVTEPTPGVPTPGSVVLDDVDEELVVEVT